jgi:hypothetical protein
MEAWLAQARDAVGRAHGTQTLDLLAQAVRSTS